MVASPIDMVRLAESVFEELRTAHPERTLCLEVQTMPPAYGDQAMVGQVFTNLLSNAIKFSRPREKAVIEVGAETDEGETVYYVRDNGVGFDTTYADKLFGVFQRLHSDEEFEGTGVGLAIVQRIILRHGGRVWAASEVGRGTTIYFTLSSTEGTA
jgi:light-regulated signal transduction histidine kinase (bacteriophytochrome)